MNVSAPTGSDDAYWQRPAAGPDSSGPDPFGAGRPVPAPDPVPTYPGPPRTPPPSPRWQPPVVQQPPPPRSMPAQDMDALNESEGSARTVTYGVGLVVAAIALVLMCLFCARVIF